MPARKMARRPARRNPIDKAAMGPGAGTYYRMVINKKTGKRERKYYSPITTRKVVAKAARRKDKDGNFLPPTDRATDMAFRRMYPAKKAKKKAAPKKASTRRAPARRAPARRAPASRSASPSAQVRAQAKRMGLKSSGTIAQVKARIAAKKRRQQAKSGSKRTRRAPAKRTRRAPAKRRVSRRSPSLATLDKRLVSARAGVRRSKAPRSVARRIHRTRGSALRLQKASRQGKLTKRQRDLLRRHGLMRVNPSLRGITEDFVGLLPKAGAAVLATAGIAWGGQQIGQRLQAMAWMPEAIKPFAVPVATGGVTVGAFYAASMIRPLAKFRDAIMFGGLAAVAVHTLAAVRVKKFSEGEGGVAVEVEGGQSLGQKLGLPIGSYVAIGEYIPQSLGGRHYGARLGEYTAIGAVPNPRLNVDGAEIRLNGYGEETFPKFGIFGEMQPIYNKKGQIVEHELMPTGTYQDEWSQMGYGREPARALDSAGDETVEEVLAEADSGVLSGSVFD